MNVAPLQLEQYFVARVQCEANAAFDPRKTVTMQMADLNSQVECQPNGKDPRHWTVQLTVRYQPATEQNAPYQFSLALVGTFRVTDAYPDDRIESLARTNAPSMLYGMAREVIRSLTAMGPHFALLLPAFSFYHTPASSSVSAAPTRQKLPKSDSIAAQTRRGSTEDRKKSG